MASDRDPNWQKRGFARVMRHNHTDAEGLLWSSLRNRKLDGLKFRRQVPIDGFIVDFYCMETKLGIELDGNQHGDARSYDERRSQILARRGIRIIRFANADVLNDLDSVLATVLRESRQNPHPTLSSSSLSLRAEGRNTGRGTDPTPPARGTP